MNYRTLADQLSLICPDDFNSEAILMLRHFFDASPAAVLAFPERDYPNDILEEALVRRKNGEPLQYILGNADFFGLNFTVSPDCLIPRSDTERLCEFLINELPNDAHMLELCTGSGCIPIATVFNRPDISCISVELCAPAARIAENNRVKNNIPQESLKILVGDALDSDYICSLGNFDAIVSNPPYIPSKDIEQLSLEVLHEPRIALDGGFDGMTFYRHFIPSYASLLNPNGFFAFEIGYDQSDEIAVLAKLFDFSVELIKDYGGNNRVAVLRHIIRN